MVYSCYPPSTALVDELQAAQRDTVLVELRPFACLVGFRHLQRILQRCCPKAYFLRAVFMRALKPKNILLHATLQSRRA